MLAQRDFEKTTQHRNKCFVWPVFLSSIKHEISLLYTEIWSQSSHLNPTSWKSCRVVVPNEPQYLARRQSLWINSIQKVLCSELFSHEMLHLNAHFAGEYKKVPVVKRNPIIEKLCSFSQCTLSVFRIMLLGNLEIWCRWVNTIKIQLTQTGTYGWTKDHHNCFKWHNHSVASISTAVCTPFQWCVPLHWQLAICILPVHYN